MVARLASPREAERAAAVARLTLVGPRALLALFAALPGSGSALRLGALEVFEGLGESRARPEVMALCRDRDGDVARRALGLLPAFADAKAVAVASRVLAEGPPDRREAAAQALSALHARGHVEAIEPLLDLVLDEEEEEALRLSTLETLLRVDARAVAPLLARLAGGRDAVARRADAHQSLALPNRGPVQSLLARLAAPKVRAEEAMRVGSALKGEGAPALPALHAALEQASRPLELEVLADVLSSVGTPASIPVLSRALQRLSRDHRGEGGNAFAAAASKLHLALADLGSRVALFDLRERLEETPPRAAESLLEVAARVGDQTLVPALARLHARERSLAPRVARSFAAIVSREGLRRGGFKALSPPDRQALDALWATLASTKARRPKGG